MEIGRQALIFRKAKRVYCWLAQRNESWYTQWQETMLKQLIESSREGWELPQARHLEGFKLLGDSFDELFEDPWFSSLWTLQEAFLRNDMVLLSQNGSVVSWSKAWPDPSDDASNPEVQKLLQSNPMKQARVRQVMPAGLNTDSQLGELIMDQIRQTATRIEQIPPRPDCFSLIQLQSMVRRLTRVVMDNKKLLEDPRGIKLLKVFRESGITTLCEDQPITLLAAARARTSKRVMKRPEDKVYGIMQVFGLKLGHSNPACSEQKFSLEQLEEQFGEALMAKHVVLSQFFLHEKPAERYKAWRNSQYSAPVPFRLLPFDGIAYQSEVVTGCKLEGFSYKDQKEDHKVAQFTGKALIITDMVMAWEWQCRDGKYDTYAPVMDLGVMLDAVPDLGVSYQDDHPAGPQESLKQLKTLEVAKETLILYLGSREISYHGAPNNYNIGLILRPERFEVRKALEGQQYYRRLGLCIWGGDWAAEIRTSGAESVHMLEPEHWRTRRGYFG